MNKIRNDSSKFVNAEIESSGADSETRIVVIRIRGSESDRSSFRFCEVWPQSGLLVTVWSILSGQTQPFACGTQWLSWWSAGLGIKGLLVRNSLPGEVQSSIYNFGLMGPGTRRFPYQWVQLQFYESQTLFWMTNLRYYCILGLAETKALHPRDKIMLKRCRMRR